MFRGEVTQFLAGDRVANEHRLLSDKCSSTAKTSSPSRSASKPDSGLVDAPYPRRVTANTCPRPTSFGAKSSKTCAVLPAPASRTIGSISAEIEHLQTDIVINRDHLNMMRCWVRWLRRLQKQGDEAKDLEPLGRLDTVVAWMAPFVSRCPAVSVVSRPPRANTRFLLGG